MTRAGKWTNPRLALLSGCAALDDGAHYRPCLRCLSRPAFQPDAATHATAPLAPVTVTKARRAGRRGAGEGRDSRHAAAPNRLPRPHRRFPADTATGHHPGARDAANAGQELPISLDAVLRLAEEQEPQVAVARARIARRVPSRSGRKRILPEVTGGHRLLAARGRHPAAGRAAYPLQHAGALRRGGRQRRLDLKAATFARLDAARKVLQQKGELKRVTTEVLLDAAGTYIDLLAAHSGQAIARNLDDELRKLLDRAEKLATSRRGRGRGGPHPGGDQRPGANRPQAQAQARAASAKLAYLLASTSCTELTPTDEQLIAFRLVDITPARGRPDAQAQATGPGLRELEGILCVIQEGWRKRQSGPPLAGV